MTKTRVHHPIPDFKALHAAHEAEADIRKQRVVKTKTVPISMEFSTDIRAKERVAFEERVAERNIENERIMEQKRREREEEEEREIRELRRKAIPRAHDVPEWYKDAPRRKDRSLGLSKS